MDKFEHIFNIDYSDVDRNIELSNIGFLRILQEIAGLHSKSVGFGIQDLAKQNLAWVILNWKLKVTGRPQHGEKVYVKTWTRRIDKIYFYRDFEVYNEKKEKIAIATSRWIWMNLKDKSVVKIEKEVIEKFKIIDEKVFPEFKFTKISENGNIINEFNYKIQRRDIDTNNHVNNLNYLDFAIESLPENVYNNLEISDVEILYKHEIMINEEIRCECFEINKRQYIVKITSITTGQANAILKLENL